MHPQLRDWLALMKSEYPEAFTGRVLELGSYDFNGTVRDFFSEADAYLGVDWRSGPGVDCVRLAHEVGYGDRHFDTVVTTEMLEHDPFWRKSLHNAVRLANRYLIVSCASPHRAPHHMEMAPVDDYYQGRSLDDILGITEPIFETLVAVERDDVHDVYYLGRRRLL